LMSGLLYEPGGARRDLAMASNVDRGAPVTPIDVWQR
jgi:hypothetical protein